MRQVRFVNVAACGTALNVFISSLTHVLCDSGAGFSSLFCSWCLRRNVELRRPRDFTEAYSDDLARAQFSSL